MYHNVVTSQSSLKHLMHFIVSKREWKYSESYVTAKMNFDKFIACDFLIIHYYYYKSQD